MTYCLLIIFLISMVPYQVLAEDIASVDWRSGIISAKGVGVPPARAKYLAQQHALACRAAKVDAQRNLLENTQGVRVDSTTLVRDAMVESDIIRTEVRGIIKGAHETARQIMPDGSCEVTLVMPIAGSLFSALISEEKFHQLTHAPAPTSSLDILHRIKQAFAQIKQAGLITEAHANTTSTVVLQNAEQLKLAKKLAQIFKDQNNPLGRSLIQHAIADYEHTRVYSGIVIDARDVQAFNLAELPWIRNQMGKRLYPNGDTPYDVIRSSLPVAYDFDMEDATKNKRVATKPILLHAVSTYKSRDSDLVLDESASKQFNQLMQKGVINQQARILIVVHP